MTRQITMDELDYNELKDRIAKANDEAAATRAELEAERARPLDDRLNAAYEFIESSKEVIDYAVGNLSPEFSRGWPAAHISKLADLVDKVGHVTPRDQGRHQVWTAFTAAVMDFDQRWALATLSKSQMTNAEIVDAAAAIKAQELAEKALAKERERLFKPAMSSTRAWLLAGGGVVLFLVIVLLALLTKS